MSKNQNADIKIVLVGDLGAGKSNIFTRLCQNEFSLESKPTKDVHLFTNDVVIDDKPLKVQVWDTTGDKKFSSIKKTYLKGARVAIIVCDVTRQQSFSSIQKWNEYIREHADPQVLKVVVGNKADLTYLRELETAEATTIVHRLGIPYLEVSALSSTNIDVMYNKVLAEAYLRLTQRRF